MQIRLLGRDDRAFFERVADDLFDEAIDASLVDQFLADPRHHMMVAIDADQIVGFASAIDYVHPDKEPQLFINEVAVATGWQHRGVGIELVTKLVERARSMGCTSVWVLTDEANLAANRLYASVARIPGVCSAERSAPVMYEFVLDRKVDMIS